MAAVQRDPAWTGPSGSMSMEKPTRQIGSAASLRAPRPSRAISNCATAAPCGVVNGISNIQRVTCASTG